MSIGYDVKDVLDEIGTVFTILRDSGNVTGGRLDYETNRQVTKPFIREYFLEAMMSYDSPAVVGDILEFGDNRIFMLMNFSPENFENEAMWHESVLYRCNVSGELKRPSGEVWDDVSYRRETTWDSIAQDCYGLLTEKQFGTGLEDEEIGQIDEFAQVLYIPSSKEIQVLDRYEPVSGEYYKVESVERRKFAGVDICSLSEDTRA